MWLNMHEPTKLTPCNARRFGAALGRRAASLACATTPIQTAIPRATVTRQARTAVTLERNRCGTGRVMFGDRQRVASRPELFGREADVGVPPEAAREDARCLDGRCRAQPRHGQQRPQGETPLPAVARGIVLRVAHHLDEREDVLPSRRVTDREVALLDVWPTRRGVGAQRVGVDLVRQEAPRAAANEEPVLHRGFLTAPEYARRIRTSAVLL